MRNITTVSVEEELFKWAKENSVSISGVVNNELRRLKNFRSENEKLQNHVQEVESNALETKRLSTELKYKSDLITKVEKFPEMAAAVLADARSHTNCFDTMDSAFSIWDKWAMKYREVGENDVGMRDLMKYVRLKLNLGEFK